MYPGMMHWWKRACEEARRAEMRADCGPGMYAHGWQRHHGGRERYSDFGIGGFGVRRPLRFLAYKLDLDDTQVEQLARILDELKTERAQAEVDDRRALSAFAAAVDGDTFNPTVAAEGGAHRVASAERLRTAVITALERIHALLDPEQRSKLAYLIRTGTLVL
jgi:Spy/CpxP family protein refolding chaperone